MEFTYFINCICDGVIYNISVLRKNISTKYGLSVIKNPMIINGIGLIDEVNLTGFCGLMDSEENILVKFSNKIKDIFIFDCNNIFVVYQNIENLKIMHYALIDKKLVFVYEIGDNFEVLDKNKEILIVSNNEFSTLYYPLEKRFLNYEFASVTKFNEKIIAKIKLNLSFEYYISFEIDMLGNIISPFYDEYKKKFITAFINNDYNHLENIILKIENDYLQEKNSVRTLSIKQNDEN